MQVQGVALDYQGSLHRSLASQPKSIVPKDLVVKYERQLDSVLSERKWVKLYQNKMTALLFLDSVENITGKDHPLTKYIQLLGYGSSTLGSLEWMHWIDESLNNPALSPAAKEALAAWKTRELRYLPMAVIFDGWRASKEMKEFITKENFPKYYEKWPEINVEEIHKKIQASITFPPEKERAHLDSSIVSACQELKVGESMPLLGGTLVHETRVKLIRTGDKSFELIHFRVGGKKSVKYGVEKVDFLFNQDYWLEYIKIKLTSLDPLEMDRHFEKLGNATELEAALQKSPQLSDSCPSQCIEAELKYDLMQSSSTGKEDYKKFKAITANDAYKERGGSIDKELALLLEMKVQKRSLYIKWAVLSDDEKLELAKWYVYVLQKLDVNETVTIKPDFETLLCLDKALEDFSKYCSPSRKKILNDSVVFFPKDLVPFCMRSSEYLFKISEQFLRNLIEIQNSPYIRMTKFLSRALPEELKPSSNQISEEYFMKLMTEVIRHSNSFPTELFDELCESQLIDVHTIIEMITKLYCGNNYEAAIGIARYVHIKGLAKTDEELLKIAPFVSSEFFIKKMRDYWKTIQTGIKIYLGRPDKELGMLLAAGDLRRAISKVEFSIHIHWELEKAKGNKLTKQEMTEKIMSELNLTETIGNLTPLEVIADKS